MKVKETAMPGVLVLEPQQFRDARGMFVETFNDRRMAEIGLPTTWRQDNFSVSHQGVVRGLHYQVLQPQGKLVRVVHGAALDVVVDIRKSSPSFGRHMSMELRAEDGLMLWIPVGFAHGFAALSSEVGFAYKVTDYYSAAGERTIVWNDPDLDIRWPFETGEAVVSSKDAAGSRFRDAEVFA